MPGRYNMFKMAAIVLLLFTLDAISQAKQPTYDLLCVSTVIGKKLAQQITLLEIISVCGKCMQ